MKKKTNKNIRYLIWTIVGVLVLIGLGYATTIVSNSPSGYLTSDNITINNTGIFYSGSKAFTKTADVVVCRGTSLADDIIKSFQCDVVCKSTDTNCADEIQSSFDNQGVIFIRTGTYPINLTTKCYSSKCGALFLDKGSTFVYGYGAKLVLGGTKNSGLYNNVGIIVNSSNNLIEGINMVNTTFSGVANWTEIGILVIDASDVKIRDVNISGINSHEIFIMTSNAVSSKNSARIYVEDSYTLGTGVGDVIGGGKDIYGTGNLSDVYILRNTIVQPYTGVYDNALDLVSGVGYHFNENVLYGSIVFGAETGSTTNSEMRGNIIYPAIGSDYGQLYNGRYDNNYNIFDSNIIVNGRLNIMGDYNTVTNNKVLETYNSTSTVGNWIRGSNNKIGDNLLISTDQAYTLVVQNNSNSIQNNEIYGGRRGIYVDGLNSEIIGNKLYNITGTNSIGIALETTSSYAIVSDNHIFINSGNSLTVGVASYGSNYLDLDGLTIHNQGTLQDAVQITSSAHNNSGTNTKVLGIKPTNAIFRIVGADQNWTYSPDYTYSNIPTGCTALGLFSDKTIHNSTASCTCIGGAWKCWGMT